jgi:hypothetical protein
MISPQRDSVKWAGLLLGGIASIFGCDNSLHDPAHAGESDSRQTTDQCPPTVDASCCSDASPVCLITASHYDQSCSADSDCVRVDFGNYCDWLCRCGGDAINRASLNRFTADIAMTPLGQGCIPGVCSCGYIFGPCCREGQCTTGSACGMDAGP